MDNTCDDLSCVRLYACESVCLSVRRLQHTALLLLLLRAPLLQFNERRSFHGLSAIEK